MGSAASVDPTKNINIRHNITVEAIKKKPIGATLQNVTICFSGAVKK
jgi:hypothetical protein